MDKELSKEVTKGRFVMGSNKTTSPFFVLPVKLSDNACSRGGFTLKSQPPFKTGCNTDLFLLVWRKDLPFIAERNYPTN